MEQNTTVHGRLGGAEHIVRVHMPSVACRASGSSGEPVLSAMTTVCKNRNL